MRDRIFLRLDEGWSLGFDINQWILLRLRKRQDECYWQGIAYVGGRTSTLLRVLADNGATVDVNAQGTIDALPDTFKEWFVKYTNEQQSLTTPIRTKELLHV